MQDLRSIRGEYVVPVILHEIRERTHSVNSPGALRILKPLTQKLDKPLGFRRQQPRLGEGVNRDG